MNRFLAPLVLSAVWLLPFAPVCAQTLTLHAGRPQRLEGGVRLELIGASSLNLSASRGADDVWRFSSNGVATGTLLVGLPSEANFDPASVSVEALLPDGSWQARRSTQRGGLMWTAVRLTLPTALRVARTASLVAVVGEGLSRCEAGIWGSGVALVAPAWVSADLTLLAHRALAVLQRFRAEGFRAPLLRRQPLIVRPDGAWCGAYEFNLSDVTGDGSLVNNLVHSERWGAYAPSALSIELVDGLDGSRFEQVMAHELFHATQSAYGFKRGPETVWLEEGLATLAGMAYGAGPAWGGLGRDSSYPFRSLELGLETADGSSEYRTQDFLSAALMAVWPQTPGRKPRFAAVVQGLLTAGVRDLATLKRYLAKAGRSLEELFADYAIAAIGSAAARNELSVVTSSLRTCEGNLLQIAFGATLRLEAAERSPFSLRAIACDRLGSARVTLSPGLRVFYLGGDFARLPDALGSRYALIVDTDQRRTVGATASFEW